MIKSEKKADGNLGQDEIQVACTNSQVVDAKEKTLGLQGTYEA